MTKDPAGFLHRRLSSIYRQIAGVHKNEGPGRDNRMIIEDFVMLQLVYISSVVGHPSYEEILGVSRRNNARDGITGLLYSDGVRYMQVLEGPERKVEAAYARIKLDARHRAAVILSRRQIAAPEFGPWEMAARSIGEDGDAFFARVASLISTAHANVRATFDGFVRLNRAA